MTRRTKLFICCSQKDSRWLERLRVHLKPLERHGLIEAWDESRIPVGDDRLAAIDQSLDEARAAVVLLSADSMAADFIHEVVLPRLLARTRSDGFRLLPVLVGPCQTDLSPLSRLQFVNRPEEALQSLSRSEQESVLNRVAQEIIRTIEPVKIVQARRQLALGRAVLLAGGALSIALCCGVAVKWHPNRSPARQTGGEPLEINSALAPNLANDSQKENKNADAEPPNAEAPVESTGVNTETTVDEVSVRNGTLQMGGLESKGGPVRASTRTHIKKLEVGAGGEADIGNVNVRGH